MSRAEDPTISHASTITTQPSTVKTETATFAAGCFWGVEETFRQVEGVVSTQVGYEGGKADKPTYELVCTETTGHAETVEVQFDPSKVTYEKLLNVFWMNHDPTTVDRQGPDIGSQYRSVIFYHDAKQKEIAEKSKETWQAKFRRPIATQIVPATTFWRAEEYHQQYSEKNGVVCHIPVIPKD
jgi:peptide-methionine (S)-S-oxide reductase